MRVCYLPCTIDGPGFYRCFFPALELEALGHYARSPKVALFREDGSEAPLVGGQLPDGPLMVGFDREWPEADVYVYQMPRDESALENCRQVKKQGKKLVIELDDDWLHTPAYNPVGEGSPDRVRLVRNLTSAIKIADAVSVATPGLRSVYKHLNPKITVLRNRLHWPMWEHITPVYEQTWRRLRVGYMGLLGWHSADVEVLKPWLGKWLREHPDVEFVAAGDPDLHDFLDVPEGQRVSTGRVDFRHLDLPDVTAVMDIGLVPLAANKFNEGKSYLKGLEYSASGIVPVCTPTQQYREFIRDGEDGLLVSTPREWRHALTSLVSDGCRLRGYGMAARAKAREFTYTNHIGEWADFYQSVIGDSGRQLWRDGDNTGAARQRAAA